MRKLHQKYSKKNILSFHKAPLRGIILLFAQRPLRGILTGLSFLIFNLVSLILIGCSQSSSPKEETVTFFGTVTLEDTTDFSGVKVSLYKPVELDTALVRINQEYPNIGVQISQETEFDHREHEPLYTTKTKTDGSWKIEGIKKGTYNVVAEKDSFGWKYLLDIVINSNNTKEIGTLYQTLFIENNLTQNLAIKDGQHLLITKDIIILENISLVMQGSGWIRLYPDVSIKNYGTIQINNSNADFVIITCTDSNDYWRDIENENNGQILMTNTIVKNSGLGIKWSGKDNLHLEKCIFKNNARALQIVNTNNVFIRNINFNSNTEGLSFGTVGNMDIQNSIMVNNENPVIGSIGKLKTENCSFNNNEIAIDFGIGDTEITHNNFESNNIALNFTAKDNYMIELNSFHQNNIDIKTNYAYNNSAGRYEIHYNNFIDNQHLYLFIIKGSILDTLKAENNWWYYTDTRDIRAKIENKAIHDGFPVIIEPILYYYNEDSGINN